MERKNRNQKNAWKKQIDSNPEIRWSIAILDVRKELDFEQRNNEDIVSSMHDDILCHIISFLPFKSAVQTSFLSTRWKDLWKRNFSVREGTMADAFTAISSFPHGCSSDQYSQQQLPKSNWGFKFNLGKGNFISVAGEPDKSLHLDFSNMKHEFQWRFDWFLELEINGLSYGFDLWFDQQINTHQPSPFSLIKVKTLYLKSVSYISSGAISSIMTNFKFLESLTLEKCHGLRSLKLEADGYPGLRKLTILDCQQLESLHLKVYGLKSLRFRGKLVSFEGVDRDLVWVWRPWYSNAFYLVDAMFDFRQGPGCRNITSCGFESFFLRMEDVKSLTLCRWVFETLIDPMLLLHPFSLGFQFNLTELWWIDYSEERFNSNALISFLKLCPRLTRLYITIDNKSYKRTNMSNCWVNGTRLSRLEDLKVVKLEGFPNEKEEILLAMRLKQEFHVEPLIIAKSNYLNCVRLLVKEGEDSYKFIETRVEPLYDLCPKHLHMSF